MMWSACWSTATDSISFRTPPAVPASVQYFSCQRNNVGSQPQSCFHLCLPGPSSTSGRAFRWEFLVLDLPGSAPFFVISSFASTLLLESGLIFQASLLHSTISLFIFVHSSSGKSSLGSFAWIIFVVSSPGVACLLPNMICFRRSQAPVVCSVHFPEVCLCPPIGWSSCFFLSSSSCCFMCALRIKPPHSSRSASASLCFKPADLE